jgi:hypothetical protein
MNEHPEELHPFTIGWFIEWSAFAFIMVIVLFGIMATISHATMSPAPSLSERNYYQDEVKIVCPNVSYPVAPEDLFPTMERCRDISILETTYGAMIQNNISAYTFAGEFDNSTDRRINGILINGNFNEVPSVKATGYSKADAKEYAAGIAEAMATYLNSEGFAGSSLIMAKDSCITLFSPDLRFPTWNMLSGTHYHYPFVHITTASSGWCINEP